MVLSADGRGRTACADLPQVRLARTIVVGACRISDPSARIDARPAYRTPAGRARSRIATMPAEDLHRDHSVYRLSDRLVERQRRQDDAIHPSTRAWRMHWEVAVVTATGRGPAQRAQLRDELVLLRLAELREGVWMRPANLRRAWPDHLGALTQRFTARPDQPHQVLVDTLWQIDHWAGTASTLLSAFTRAAAPADTFTVAAAIVRHLLTDPVLPEQLLPADWPASHLRAAYAEYQSDVLRLTRNGRDAPER